MSLKDCLIAAEQRGAISKEEHAFLAGEFDRQFAQARLSMGDAQARAKAREQLEAALRGSAIEKKRRADLTEASRLTVKRHLLDYRDRDGKANVYEAAMSLLSHYGFRGTSSVRGKTEAIVASVHGKLSDLMTTFQRSGALGKRANLALVSDVLKEMHGEASGDATAKMLARSVSTVFEDLRQRFNAAGGAIGKIENYGLPHSHDRLKVVNATRDQWKAFIRPLLDSGRMVNPVTGQPVGAGGIDAALDHVFASIVSENRAHLKPSMQRRGLGSIASQRQDERFLIFKDAASWENYHRRFGQTDPVQVIFNHVNGMAKDIAAMEVLGPNPAAMVEYLKQLVLFETGKAETGQASMAKRSKRIPLSQARWQEHRIDSLWNMLRGRPTVASGAAQFTGDVKNVTTSAQLGSTVIVAAATDPFIAAAARKLAGLKVTRTIGDMARALKKAGRDEIVRSGVIWDEYLHVMADELRFAGPAVGSEWSRWLADRTVTWSGLKPLTTGRKLVEARAWQRHIAEISDKTFGKLDKRFRTALEGFGVDADTWDIWRASVDQNGFATAAEIERRGGGVRYLDAKQGALSSADAAAEAKAQRHRAAAEKLSEVIHSWGERSVPSGTPNARSVFITAHTARGSFLGELAEYFLQYKSFGLSFTVNQIEAIAEMAAARGGGQGRRTGLGYFAPLFIGLTVGGYAYMAIRSMLDGKEPPDPSDPAVIAQATITGGGFGLFGDFVKATENRFGQSVIEAVAGPGITYVGESAILGRAVLQEAIFGSDEQAGRKVSQHARRYTPVLSSHWATRGAFNRVILDNLQWMLDPEADKSWKAQARLAKKNGTAFFMPPGSFTPAGGPR